MLFFPPACPAVEGGDVGDVATLRRCNALSRDIEASTPNPIRSHLLMHKQRRPAARFSPYRQDDDRDSYEIGTMETKYSDYGQLKSRLEAFLEFSQPALTTMLDMARLPRESNHAV